MERSWYRWCGGGYTNILLSSTTSTTTTTGSIWRSVTVILSLLLVILLVFIFVNRKVYSSSPESSNESDTHYAIVLDAGSSGTRAYLYTWPEHSGDKHELLKISPILQQDGEPLVKKVSPGLSSMGSTPDNSYEYIRPLLQFANDNIPKDKHKETPLYILATAGMRLLDKQQQEAILDNLRKGIGLNFQFYFPDGHLEIISGKQEGIYQWLAINYVLGKLEAHSKNSELVSVEVRGGQEMVLRPRTVGALDMGGASQQVAMEITTNLQMEGMKEEDKAQVVEINLGTTSPDPEHTYRLFVTTFLGFGANQALDRYHRTLFLKTALPNGVQGLDSDHRISDPCRPLGMKDNVTISLDLPNLAVDLGVQDQLRESQTVHLYGTGRWDECYSILSNFTNQPEQFVNCRSECPDSRMRSPPIQFDNSEFYGFSEFWYSMEDVLGMGGQYIANRFKQAGRDFCSTRWHLTWAKYLHGNYPNSDTERLQTQCFKSAWVSVGLHEGLKFPTTYGHLTTAPNTVYGKVVHWTLGALLYRTRFFPLRSIESDGDVHHGTYHSKISSGYLYSHYIVWLCFFSVSVCITIYIIRLRRYVKPSSLRKVPSLNYWLAAQDNDEEAVKEQADYLYSHTKVFVG